MNSRSRNKNIEIQDFSLPQPKAEGLNSSLTRVSNIIECLSQGMNTNVEIATYCGYHQSTTHRLLKDLRQLGWVIQDDLNSCYYLGPFISRVAANAIANHRFFVINALREMTNLADKTGEAVNLAVMEGLHYLRVHEIPSRYDLRVSDDSRGYGQIFTPGATGKVLLSQLPDPVLKETLNKVALVSRTNKSVKDKKVLYRQIRETRERGYAISRSERTPGAAAIAAPVVNYSWPAAIAVIGPESRMQPILDTLTATLPDIARRVSDNIARALNTQKPKGWQTESNDD